MCVLLLEWFGMNAVDDIYYYYHYIFIDFRNIFISPNTLSLPQKWYWEKLLGQQFWCGVMSPADDKNIDPHKFLSVGGMLKIFVTKIFVS